MTTTTHRRLVTKRKYLKVMGLKLTLNALATTAVAAGLISTVNFVCWIVIEHVSQKDTLRMWLGCNLLSLSISLLFLFGALMYRASGQIEPVEVLTEQNACRLPLEETLVRIPSDATVNRNDDLLRAHHTTPEQHCDELLRSISGGTQQ